MNPKSDRKGLGRGLSALMADINLERVDAGMSSQGRIEQRLPIEQIVPNKDQPRRTFSDEDLGELAESIRQKGIIQPIIVRKSDSFDGFEIVAGERRWRAAQLAKLHEVPVIVRDYSDLDVLEIAIVENIQRRDLNAIEEAMGYRQLMERFGHTQEKIATALSKSRSHIANLLRLLQLPEDVQRLVTSGALSAGHARALISTSDASGLAKKIVSAGLSVRQAEQLAKDDREPKKRRSGPNDSGRLEKDADTRALEGDLSNNLKMAVSIYHEPGGEKGILKITYNTLDDLDRLCRALAQIDRDF